MGNPISSGRSTDGFPPAADDTARRSPAPESLYSGVVRLRPDRKSTQVLAQLQLLAANAPVTPFIGQILNLSASGLMLESDAPLDLKHEVAITFFVPGAQMRATGTARVVRRVEAEGTPRWGLRFTVLEQAARHALNEYVGRDAVKPR